MAPEQARPAAALTPKGKLLFLARVVGLPADGRRLLLPASQGESALAHLKKFVIFQKVDIADRSAEFVRIGLYGPGAAEWNAIPEDAMKLAPDGEFAADLLVPSGIAGDLRAALERAGAAEVSEETAETLRIEAGRPTFGADADSNNLIDELGLDSAVSTTKGCYVGQEIVARMRTYGRVNRRLVGFRFPEGPIEPGAILKLPEEEEPGKIEQGRVTSAALSPAFGPIGLGFAFREVPEAGRLVSARQPSLGAVVSSLPFTE
jgi:folate-binding protein YgfZ